MDNLIIVGSCRSRCIIPYLNLDNYKIINNELKGNVFTVREALDYIYSLYVDRVKMNLLIIEISSLKKYLHGVSDKSLIELEPNFYECLDVIKELCNCKIIIITYHNLFNIRDRYLLSYKLCDWCINNDMSFVDPTQLLITWDIKKAFKMEKDLIDVYHYSKEFENKIASYIIELIKSDFKYSPYKNKVVQRLDNIEYLY